MVCYSTLQIMNGVLQYVTDHEWCVTVYIPSLCTTNIGETIENPGVMGVMWYNVYIFDKHVHDI